MCNSFIILFCNVYIVWCTISYLLYLFACMCSCDVLDGVPFEEQQEQGFEEAEQQQQFKEGKWFLIILVVPDKSLNTLYSICMHVSII